jgi:hypothetical protein
MRIFRKCVGAIIIDNLPLCNTLPIHTIYAYCLPNIKLDYTSLAKEFTEDGWNLGGESDLNAEVRALTRFHRFLLD